ncbi:multidrug efflux SMR transporter [Methyloceanibacter sp.]|uniref:DMT family transporter n=1 Tax=Methyloceanibacter sp. TaxID=1965321 RepID=UPI002D6BE372|nr:multidrug efflux SMR transporter [Methyloceanibacter sp.]HZP08590.1 multidrug efflux SMR transporter [Methyloceanibacter sp.]
MAWVYLFLAGLLEVGYASTMKLTEGFTRLWPTLFFAFCIVTSFVLLTRAAREIPIGTAYAVWGGIGTAGTVIVGILAYNEPVTVLRMVCLVMLLASIVGLRLATPS